MPQEVNISELDITYAERILLSEGQRFDEERRQFIRDLNTFDLQAVPGSGKTTALLAKLLILERYMPLKEGRGILVISHTNAAVDEIRERIGKYCPKLFRYPNFIGTIQGFVDRFLAVPFYSSMYKKKPLRIDSDAYNERVRSILAKPWLFSFGVSKNVIRNIIYLKSVNESLFYNFRLGMVDEKIELLKELNGSVLEIVKPRGKSKNYKDYSDEEKQSIQNWLFKLKINLLKQDAILHYDDAYFLANRSIKIDKTKPTLLQQRFQYVFIDEMQDMDIHQHDLLENIFHPSSSSKSIIQRIGDKNQAIFNGRSVKLDNVWSERNKIRYMSGSHRLIPRIANLVEKLALTRSSIEGRNCNSDGSIIDIKPIIFVFNDQSRQLVIPEFANKIKELQSSGIIPINSANKYMAIAWRKKHQDINKLGLQDYWSNFIDANISNKNEYNVLEDYIFIFDNTKMNFKFISDNILNALLKILRIENVQDENDKIYTKSTLFGMFKKLNNNEYDSLKLNIYNWSKRCLTREIQGLISEIRCYIPIFLSYFQKEISISRDFIFRDSEITLNTDDENKRELNTFVTDEINIDIGTVHSVKGQTHTATLYLETFFKRGYGNYESERLRNQLKGVSIVETLGSKISGKNVIRQTCKMAYVGFSRPTHLLCIAVHKERFDSVLSDIDDTDWDIIEIGELG